MARDVRNSHFRPSRWLRSLAPLALSRVGNRISPWWEWSANVCYSTLGDAAVLTGTTARARSLTGRRSSSPHRRSLSRRSSAPARAGTFDVGSALPLPFRACLLACAVGRPLPSAGRRGGVRPMQTETVGVGVGGGRKHRRNVSSHALGSSELGCSPPCRPFSALPRVSIIRTRSCRDSARRASTIDPFRGHSYAAPVSDMV